MSRSLSLALALSALAASSAAAAPKDDVAKIVASPAFKTATATLDKEHERTVADIITLTEIPAPPFKEAERGKAYKAMFEAHGLTEVEIDSEGNVMGLRKGTGGGPVVVVSAHLDTVFPEGTDVKVRREGTKLHAPGVADDTHNLAVLLAWIRAMDAAKIQTKSDILFVGTVGEEGAGDLRGVRYFFNEGKYKDRTKAFFSVDGLSPNGITHIGVGSKRFKTIMQQAADHENATRSTSVGKVSVEIKPIGDRPAGQTPKDAPLVQSMTAAIEALGYQPEYQASSTDSNAPMALGVPAITIGGGGKGGRAHSLDEWIDVAPEGRAKAMSVALAAILAVAGVN